MITETIVSFVSLAVKLTVLFIGISFYLICYRHLSPTGRLKQN